MAIPSVNCLYTNVSELVLNDGDTVDISVLCQYNGTGKCQYVMYYGESFDRNRGQMTQWAHIMGWKVNNCDSHVITNSRN